MPWCHKYARSYQGVVFKAKALRKRSFNTIVQSYARRNNLYNGQEFNGKMENRIKNIAMNIYSNGKLLVKEYVSRILGEGRVS